MRLSLAAVKSNPAHLFIIGGGDARSLWVALSERAVSPTTPLPRAGTPNSQKSTSSRSFPPGPHLSIPTFQPSRTICNLIFAERTVAFLLPVECFLVLFSLFPFPEEGNPSQTFVTAPEKKRGFDKHLEEHRRRRTRTRIARSTVWDGAKELLDLLCGTMPGATNDGPSVALSCMCANRGASRRRAPFLQEALEIVDIWLIGSSRQQLLGQGRCWSGTPPRAHGRGEADER